MKNIALCFDRAQQRPGSPVDTNTATLAGLLSSGTDQVVWTRGDTGGSRHPFSLRSARLDSARESVALAYEFLVQRWEPDDRIYLFGAGQGASCARALARLLGTVGLLRGPGIAGWTASDFRDYALATYAMPRTQRGVGDWQRVGRLAAQISGSEDVAVDVTFLGLWDTSAIPGLPRRCAADLLDNVGSVRHALAIDGGVGPFRAEPLRPDAEVEVEEVWFRGAHCDVAGGRHGCPPLADIALDWVLDGAVAAGAVLKPPAAGCPPSPSADDALAGHLHPVALRKIPEDAAVHASVETYVRTHPAYWRRLPDHIVWTDPDWAARGERLTAAPSSPLQAHQLVGA